MIRSLNLWQQLPADLQHLALQYSDITLPQTLSDVNLNDLQHIFDFAIQETFEYFANPEASLLTKHIWQKVINTTGQTNENSCRLALEALTEMLPASERATIKKEWGTNLFEIKRVKETEEKIHDLSLELMWSKVSQNQLICRLTGLPTNAKQIRTWMQNSVNQAHLQRITDLNLSELGLVAIPEEIKYFSNLNRLFLKKNLIQDLTPLTPLTNLTWLDLDDNQIQDITPLNALTNLIWLYLDDNEIQDLTPLIPLTRLTKLGLSNNPIINIKPLASLINLRYLNLVKTLLVNISLLTSFDKLTKLYLLPGINIATRIRANLGDCTREYLFDRIVNYSKYENVRAKIPAA